MQSATGIAGSIDDQLAARIRADTDRSMTLSAPDAVAYGIADRVISGRPPRPAGAN